MSRRIWLSVRAGFKPFAVVCIALRGGYVGLMELSDQDQQALALLAWYRDMGVDEPLGEQPFDWLTCDARVPGAEVMARVRAARAAVDVGAPDAVGRTGHGARSGSGSGAPPQSAPKSTTSMPARSSQVSRGPEPVAGQGRSAGRDVDAAATIQELAGVTNLEALRAKLEGFEGCGLKQTAKNTCFYRGSALARVMIIGEAPGRDEDRAGKPFVGRAGQLLDRMLAAIGLDEQSVHITNIVYWRPPGNRTPTAIEARACRPFVEAQVRLVDPELIVLVGGAAAKSVLDTTQGIMRLRGRARTLEIGGAVRNVIATLHPAYLLRTPAAKRLAWQDLLWVQGQLDP